MSRLKSTSFRTFLLSPILVVTWEYFLTQGRLNLNPWFLPMLAWGYLQYRLVGLYRLARGGGGPGMDTPPERLVTTGPFAYSRNPMYLGHIIFLLALALSLQSVLGAIIMLATALWFQSRVWRDEKQLSERFGQKYVDYCARVMRWVPGMF